MDYGLVFPNELIQYVEFLRAEEFFCMPFSGKDYKIIAKDDVGNFIGVAPNKQVFYLETACDTHSDNIRYIAKDIEMFIQELNLYKQYSENYYLEENPSDEALEKYADGFKELVIAIDPNVFCNAESYWSIIVEQMEYGQI